MATRPEERITILFNNALALLAVWKYKLPFAPVPPSESPIILAAV
jgi:hypothetical protein